jgi:hypothetical protein
LYQQPEMNPNASEYHYPGTFNRQQQPEMNPNAPEYYYPGTFNRQQQPQQQYYPPRQRCRWIYCCDPVRPPYGGGGGYGGPGGPGGYGGSDDSYGG